MIIEQFIFVVFSFAIFVYMFFKMIKNNDTSYVVILILEALGIALNFAEVLLNIQLNMLMSILKYIFSILISFLLSNLNFCLLYGNYILIIWYFQ